MGSFYRLKTLLSPKRFFSAITVFFFYFLLTQSLFYTHPIVLHENDIHPIVFSTEEKSPLKASLLHAINKAERKIILLIYNVCDTHILRALKQAGQRGVKVTVIADPSSAHDVEALTGSAIHTYLRKPRGLMHLKILLIDDREVWLGSANMSLSSLEVHGNTFLAFSSTTLSAYIEQFAESLINHKPFREPPLFVQANKQALTLFLHPFHGKESLSFLIEKIEQAKQRIFVAMYTFTHKDLLDSLIRAKKRGVDVRVVFDKDSSKNTSKIAYTRLKKTSIPTLVRAKEGLLHHKFAWIDDTLAIGSCNWTKSGFMANCDCILWLHPLNTEETTHLHAIWQEIEGYSA